MCLKTKYSRYLPAGRQGSAVFYLMYYIYILKSKIDHQFYTGLTNDLNRRIKEHNACQV